MRILGLEGRPGQASHQGTIPDSAPFEPRRLFASSLYPRTLGHADLRSSISPSWSGAPPPSWLHPGRPPPRHPPEPFLPTPTRSSSGSGGGCSLAPGGGPSPGRRGIGARPAQYRWAPPRAACCRPPPAAADSCPGSRVKNGSTQAQGRNVAACKGRGRGRG